jgi:putative transcriptional regulator
MPKTERELRAREAKRDIGTELLESVRQMKAAKVKPVAQLKSTPAAAARLKNRLGRVIAFRPAIPGRSGARAPAV